MHIFHRRHLAILHPRNTLLEALDNGAWERNAIDHIAGTASANSDLIEEILAGTAVNNSGDVGIDGVITKDTVTGEIHIGENSLITNEVNGVQELYAEDASGNPIDINVNNGSDLLVNGISVTTQINNNADDIADNADDIADNATAINTVETGAGLNANGTYKVNSTGNYINTATSLASADNLLDIQVKLNADDIDDNADDIADNATAIGNNATAIGNNATAIGNNSADININRDGIAMAAAISHSTILPGKKQALDIAHANFEGSSAMSINYSRRVAQGVQINLSHASAGDSHINKVGVGIQW
jgi:hypothetical protein